MNARVKKLQLRKESLRTLSSEEMADAAGGAESIVLGTNIRSVCLRCYPLPNPTYQTSPIIIIAY